MILALVALSWPSLAMTIDLGKPAIVANRENQRWIESASRSPGYRYYAPLIPIADVQLARKPRFALSH